MSIKDELAKHNAIYKRAPAFSAGVPDGDYLVFVDSVSLDETNNGLVVLKWILQITSPEDYCGLYIYTNNFLSSEKSIQFLKNNLQKCGLFLDNLEDLPDNLEMLLNKNLKVSKKTSGDYTNVFFKELGNDNDIANNTTISDNDIPF